MTSDKQNFTFNLLWSSFSIVLLRRIRSEEIGIRSCIYFWSAGEIKKQKILVITVYEIIKYFSCLWNFLKKICSYRCKKIEMVTKCCIIINVFVLLSVARLMLWNFMFLILIIDLPHFLGIFSIPWTISLS